MGVMRDIPFGEKFGKLTILREVDAGKHANGKITEEAYQALYNYTVDIND